MDQALEIANNQIIFDRAKLTKQKHIKTKP